MSDIATALTTSLARDGRGGMLGPLALNGNTIGSLADGVADTDAATVAQMKNATQGPTGPANNTYTSRAAIAASPITNARATLVDGLRSGDFRWSLGDYSAAIAHDPQQGVYIASTLFAPTAGCWIRVQQGPMLTGWFGVLHDAETSRDTYNPNATNNITTINAASALATFIARPLLLSPGAVMWDGPGGMLVNYSLSIAGGDKTRGSTIYQNPGSANPLFTLASGPVPDCRFFGLYIRCNGVTGADCFYFEATGPVNGSGGLFEARFMEVKVENCGGVGLKLWTGTVAGDYVHQFPTFDLCSFGRTGAEASRAISFAGRVAQFYIKNSSQVSCSIDTTRPLDGVNIVVGARYPEGDYYSHMRAGGTSVALTSSPAVGTI
ncbi:MAG: hypothetical protein ACRYGI_11355, partial [Janthinobacterium lividum]